MPKYLPFFALDCNLHGERLLSCPLRVTSGRSVDPRWMSAHSHKRTFRRKVVKKGFANIKTPGRHST